MRTQFGSVRDFVRSDLVQSTKDPIALIFAEDAVELSSTLSHHARMGFGLVALLAPEGMVAPELPADVAPLCLQVTCAVHERDTVPRVVNALIAAQPRRWIYYCYNAEYLFHPFSETRDVIEMLAFHAEERRSAMLAQVVDLYAGDLYERPKAVDLDEAYMDSRGYFALARYRGRASDAKERQMDMFGGLKRRFEEHVPYEARRIDRIALFQARKGLELRTDHTFNDEEYNTYACPWHNNLTVAIGSFRAAKALCTNPGSRYEINSFLWDGSVPFEWRSQQLMDLGLMEPGQWF